MGTQMHPHLQNKKGEKDPSVLANNLHATGGLSSGPCHPFLANITGALPATTCSAGRQGQDTFGAALESK